MIEAEKKKEEFRKILEQAQAEIQQKKEREQALLQKINPLLKK